MKKLLAILTICLAFSSTCVFASSQYEEPKIFETGILEPLNENDYQKLFEEYGVENYEELVQLFTKSRSSEIFMGFGKTTSSNVNLRKGPGTSYASLGQLEKGTSLAVYQVINSGDWWSVDVQSGTHKNKSGWVSMSYVDITSPASID